MSSNGSSTHHSPEREELCSLLENGERCTNKAGSGVFTKKMKSLAQKKQKLYPDSTASHNRICDHHRTFVHSLRNKRKRKDSEEENDFLPEIDFLQLQMNTLRRYKRHYKLQLKPGSNKIQLVEAVTKHFRTLRINEKKVVQLFISMVKSHKSKLDHPKPID
ncbi:PREDICTED: histone deacetylase complex subunit SAP30L-like [Amphimedon queenslandica]|uniref:Histone deacetylase complex subunit SAP30 Sin3 binding domain-containing protein n=1 Tax=Amphimedon queenslandica TaxID=400682 RepID=A0A1X7VPI2_AMPQE|nr:PREDICTED: histone deacetylase complex subunit SAP30L-like [Amphimedon queenslandica]|eukprot:XP_003383626.1 PREDICTED: histone deacetylase complex subunit SAP30L-like [Amphimedon queenslandica]